MKLRIGARKKLSNKDRMYIIYIFIIPYLVFRPDYLTRIPITSSLTSYGALLIGVYYLLTAITSVTRKKRANTFICLVLLYFIWYYISAICNGIAFEPNTIIGFIRGLSRVVILVYSLKSAFNHNRESKYYTGMMLSLFSMIIINLITILRNPMGLFQIYVYGNNTPTAMYFLGNDNSFWYYIIISVTVALMYYATEKKHVKVVFGLCVFFSVVTPLITRSLTSSISVITMVVLMGIDLFKHDVLKGRLFKAKTFFIFIIVFNAILLLTDPVKLLAENLYKWFGKNFSFISRVNIWSTVKELILEHPIIGHGIPKESNYVIQYATGHSVSAHNDVLQILYFGGAFALALVIVLLFKAYRGMNKNKYEEYGFFACLGLFAYGIAALTEVPSNDFVLIFLLCNLYYSKYITQPRQNSPAENMA